MWCSTNTRLYRRTGTTRTTQPTRTISTTCTPIWWCSTTSEGNNQDLHWNLNDSEAERNVVNIYHSRKELFNFRTNISVEWACHFPSGLVHLHTPQIGQSNTPMMVLVYVSVHVNKCKRRKLVWPTKSFYGHRSFSWPLIPLFWTLITFAVAFKTRGSLACLLCHPHIIVVRLTSGVLHLPTLFDWRNDPSKSRQVVSSAALFDLDTRNLSKN